MVELYCLHCCYVGDVLFHMCGRQECASPIRHGAHRWNDCDNMPTKNNKNAVPSLLCARNPSFNTSRSLVVPVSDSAVNLMHVGRLEHAWWWVKCGESARKRMWVLAQNRNNSAG